MQLADITVEVRDKDLHRMGVIRPEDLILDLEDLHNNVGTWRLSLAAENPLAGVLRTPGSGIIVTGPSDVLMSGPTITPQTTANAEDPAGTVVIEGVSDSIVLADMLAFPDPTNVDPTTQTLSHDVRSGNVETVMHGFVNANIGPTAPVARRKAGLVMGTNLNRGPTVKKSARFAVLGDLLQELATIAGLGFRVVQRDSDLVFETYAVTDRSAYIRLDVANNSLASSQVAITPPGVTQVIVAGQGELVDRQFYAATTPDALTAEAEWGRRIERFIDQRQTDDTLEHEAKAKAVLAAEGFTGIAVNAIPANDSTMRYGQDWGMGDTVAAIVDDGEAKAVVTGFILKADSSGVRLGVRLGTAGEWSQTTSSTGRLSDVERRISYLERAESAATDVSGINARLTTAESDITALESSQAAQDTVLNAATSAATPNTLAKRDGSGGIAFDNVTANDAPATVDALTRRDYVDTQADSAGGRGYLGSNYLSTSGTVGNTATAIISVTVTIPANLATGRRIKIHAGAFIAHGSGIGGAVSVNSTRTLSVERPNNVGSQTYDANMVIFDDDLTAGSRTFRLAGRCLTASQVISWRSPFITVEIV